MIDLPLYKVSSAENGWRMVVDQRGKAARTAWEKLTEKDGRSMNSFFPETGRTHQIRAHATYGLSSANVGVPAYGGGTPEPMRSHREQYSVVAAKRQSVRVELGVMR